MRVAAKRTRDQPVTSRSFSTNSSSLSSMPSVDPDFAAPKLVNGSSVSP